MSGSPMQLTRYVAVIVTFGPDFMHTAQAMRVDATTNHLSARMNAVTMGKKLHQKHFKLGAQVMEDHCFVAVRPYPDVLPVWNTKSEIVAGLRIFLDVKHSPFIVASDNCPSTLAFLDAVTSNIPRESMDMDEGLNQALNSVHNN